MLILTRKKNETINIGDDVQLTVLSVNGNSVRIGVSAPISVPVHRSEIYHRINLDRKTIKINTTTDERVTES